MVSITVTLQAPKYSLDLLQDEMRNTEQSVVVYLFIAIIV